MNKTKDKEIEDLKSQIDDSPEKKSHARRRRLGNMAHLFTMDLVASLVAIVSYGSALGLIFNHETCTQELPCAVVGENGRTEEDVDSQTPRKVLPSSSSRRWRSGAPSLHQEQPMPLFSIGRAASSYSYRHYRFWGCGKFPYALIAILLSLSAMVQATQKDCPMGVGASTK